ncbi:MAG: EamA family transporter [Chitinophagaceae bacterium]|nr:EamA family transporter [Chitinophagaceae bacterium]
MKQALIKLHAAVFLWGFTGVLGKAISLNEGLLVWYRMLITVVSLLALQWWGGKLQGVPRKTGWTLAGIGTVLAIHWCFFYGSIKASNVSIALICLSASGLFTALLAPLFNNSKIAWREVLLGLIGIAGIYLIFHFDPHYKTGIMLGLVASLLACVYTILSERQVASVPSETIMLYQLSGGFTVLTLLMPLYLHFHAEETYVHLLPSGKDWLLLLVMSWFCTIIAINLALQSLKKLSAFTQNLTINMEPVYGIIFAFLIYRENEHLSAGFFLGFGLIALAVILQMVSVIRGGGKA